MQAPIVTQDRGLEATAMAAAHRWVRALGFWIAGRRVVLSVGSSPNAAHLGVMGVAACTGQGRRGDIRPRDVAEGGLL